MDGKSLRQVVGEEAAVCRGGGSAGCVWGGDMDSVEENEEMGNLSTCFQGNRGLKNTGSLEFLFSTLHCPLARYCRRF